MAKKYKKKKSKYPGYMSFNKGLGLNPAYGEDGGGLTGMMKARLAYAQMHGNPSAQRMVAPVDNPYVFEDGNTGTHYMASMGEYAVPQIQNINNNLVLGNYGPESLESIRFDRPEDAEYFAENYKQVAPALRKNGGWLDEFEEGGFIGKTTVEAGGAKHVVYTGKKGDIMVTHPEMDNGAWDTINLTEVSDAKSLAQGVDATLDWHRKHPYHKKKKAEGGYMKPADLDPATLKKYAEALKIQENSVRSGYDKSTGRWFPHKSYENDPTPTIAYGHRLKPGEDFSKGLTEQEAIDLLYKDIASEQEKAKRVIDKRFKKKGTYDSLSQDKQMLLTDFAYNAVIDKFPAFTKAVVEGDKATMLKEYERSSNGVPLKERNKWTLGIINSLPSKEEEERIKKQQQQIETIDTEKQEISKPWYTRAYDYVRGLMPFEEGGYTYQQGGRTPIYVDNPNDPRLQAYNDSLVLNNMSLKALNSFNKVIEPLLAKGKKNEAAKYWQSEMKDTPKVERAWKNLIKLNKVAPRGIMKESKYDSDFGVNIFKKPSQPYKYKKPEVVEEDIIYVDDPNDPNLLSYQKQLELYNKFNTPGKKVYTNVPIEKHEDYKFLKERGLSDKEAKKQIQEQIKTYEDWAFKNYGMKPIGYNFNKFVGNYHAPIFNKPKEYRLRENKQPVVTQEVKKEEPIDRSILTYRITELPKEEQRGNQRYVATVVPETYQKYGTGFAERYPLTQEQYDAMGATDTMKSREGKDVPVKYLKKYGGKYRAPKYNDKRIGRGDDGGEVWLYEEGGWLDEL